MGALQSLAQETAVRCLLRAGGGALLGKCRHRSHSRGRPRGRRTLVLGQPLTKRAVCCPLQCAGDRARARAGLCSQESLSRGHRRTCVHVCQAPGISRMWPHRLVAGNLALFGESEEGLSRIIVKVISAVSYSQRERVPGRAKPRQ